jgi:ribosomal protein S18 acetylase RimI-like enzyme
MTSSTPGADATPAARAARVRRANPSDASTLFGMITELADHQGQSGAVSVTIEGLHVLLHRDDVIVLLAERDHRALGYVSAVWQLNVWAGREILALDDLYVREAVRDGGIGRALMLELAIIANRTNATVRWEAETDNSPALRFYERLGARLQTKVIAAWLPEGYRKCLAQRSP